LISSFDTTNQSYACNITDRRYYQPKRNMVIITNTKAEDEINVSINIAELISSETVTADAATSNTFHSSHEEFRDIIITNSCWKRIQQLATKKNQSIEAIYLRVYVDAGGCSGFTYQFEISTEDIDEKEDIVYTHISSGSRLVIDRTSYDLIKGSTIDYVQEMIKSNFSVLSNPQSESACGCGSSFALKNFQNNPAVH
jgi:iron-sulfur cluster assembly 2